MQRFSHLPKPWVSNCLLNGTDELLVVQKQAVGPCWPLHQMVSTVIIMQSFLDTDADSAFSVVAAQLKRAMNGILFVLTTLSVYSHILVDEKFERTAPALVSYS